MLVNYYNPLVSQFLFITWILDYLIRKKWILRKTLTILLHVYSRNLKTITFLFSQGKVVEMLYFIYIMCQIASYILFILTMVLWSSFWYFYHSHFLNFLNVYWHVVDLQSCVNFYCTIKWFSYTYIYSPFIGEDNEILRLKDMHHSQVHLTLLWLPNLPGYVKCDHSVILDTYCNK